MRNIMANKRLYSQLNLRRLLLLPLGFLPLLVQAQTYVVTTLGGKTLVPVVQQQLNSLPNGGTVSEYQGKLVINTTPQNYRAVQGLIAQIDQPPQSLTVAVRVGDNRSNYQNTGYGNVGVINNQVFVNGRWQNSQSQTTGNQLYQVQTLSGSPASIGLEQILATPMISVNGRQRAYPQVQIGNRLLSAHQGISVLPTALPNGQIQVQIAQSNGNFSSFNRQSPSPIIEVNGQNLATSVTLYPNQWTTIGYVSNQSQSNGSYGNTSQSLQTPIQIRVR